MNYIKYSVRPTQIQNSVAIISYALPDDRGYARLLSVAWNGEAADYFKQATMREVPATISYVPGKIPMEMMMWQQVGCEIRDISEIDLSFDRFWKLYGVQMGSRNYAEKYWNKLKETERILALGAVARMQRYYRERNIEVPFPTTYLNQRRWENLFE